MGHAEYIQAAKCLGLHVSGEDLDRLDQLQQALPALTIVAMDRLFFACRFAVVPSASLIIDLCRLLPIGGAGGPQLRLSVLEEIVTLRCLGLRALAGPGYGEVSFSGPNLALPTMITVSSYGDTAQPAYHGNSCPLRVGIRPRGGCWCPRHVAATGRTTITDEWFNATTANETRLLGIRHWIQHILYNEQPPAGLVPSETGDILPVPAPQQGRLQRVIELHEENT